MPKQGNELSLKPIPNPFYGDVYLAGEFTASLGITRI